MNSVDEQITHYLEEIDASFVKALDIVGSMNKHIKAIAMNMKELDEYSKVDFIDSSKKQTWYTFFNLCNPPNNNSTTVYLIYNGFIMQRESVGTLVLTDDENTMGLMQPMDNDSIPSFLQDGDDAYLKYMSPPRTTQIYKVSLYNLNL